MTRPHRPAAHTHGTLAGLCADCRARKNGARYALVTLGMVLGGVVVPAVAGIVVGAVTR